MEEIWKPSLTFPEIMVSSFGRILLPPFIRKMPNGGIFIHKTKPIFGVKTKSSNTAKHQYMNVSNRRFGNLKIHKLVCEAFHGPKPSSKHVVIHLNENGTDNRAENLRWGTQKENLNMPGFIKYCKGRVGENSPYVKGRKKRMENSNAPASALNAHSARL